MNDDEKRELFGSGIVTNTLGYDVYSEILASTIGTLKTPANVGVYAGWGSGKSYLLNKIKKILTERSSRYPTCRGRFFLCIWMLIRLVYFIPPTALPAKNRREVRFITAYFNALEYAGSDNLWAGLVTRLVGAVGGGVGILPSAIFRAKPVYAVCNDVYSIDKRKICFRPKTCCCTGIPVYVVVISVLLFCLAGGIVLLIYALDKQAFLLQESLSSNVTSPPGTLDNTQKSSFALGSIILSIPIVAFLKNFIPVFLKVINTQKAKIAKILSKPDFSKELGVMAKIKGEIRHVTKLVRFMELFEGRRIVITIFIDDLDKLPQHSIAPLLQAIKILLSDPESRFVSIIAMDPYCVSDALEMGIQSQFPAINISGHRFLKHLIQVPFCIPEMNNHEKRHLLRTLVKRDRLSKSRLSLDTEDVGDVVDGTTMEIKIEVEFKGNDKVKMRDMSLKRPLLENSSKVEDKEIPLIEIGNSKLNVPLDQQRDVTESCDCVMAELRNRKIFPFIKNNLQEMLRLIGIIKVTTRVIFSRLKDANHMSEDLIDFPLPQGILPLHLAAWVVLVAQWPYRTTWLVQQVDDRDDGGSRYDDSTPLMDVYRHVEKYFTLVRTWKKLIKLDEDPDTLEQFLQTHTHWLNVGFLNKLLPYTISLDRSLKSIVSWTSVERDARSHGNVVHKHLSMMTVPDVIAMIRFACEGSQRLEEYEKKCTEHNISGPALLRGNLEEIKQCLEMSLGDWIQFSHSLIQMKSHHKFESMS